MFWIENGIESVYCIAIYACGSCLPHAFLQEGACFASHFRLTVHTLGAVRTLDLALLASWFSEDGRLLPTRPVKNACSRHIFYSTLTVLAFISIQNTVVRARLCSAAMVWMHARHAFLTESTRIWQQFQTKNLWFVHMADHDHGGSAVPPRSSSLESSQTHPKTSRTAMIWCSRQTAILACLASRMHFCRRVHDLNRISA